MTALIDRIPPNSIEAEQAVLGALLVAPELFQLVATIVQPSDFYAPLHETIFAAMTAIVDRSDPLDKVSLTEELRARGMLDAIGGPAYLSGLMDVVPHATSAEYYAKVVREKAMLRDLIRAGVEIARTGYEGEEDVDATLSAAEAAVARVTLRRVAVASVEDPAAAIDEIIDDVRSGRRDETTPSPWAELNRRTGGFLAGELIAVPAAPSIGKSAFIVCWAEYVSARVGPVLFGSFEMAKKIVHRRRMAALADVSVRAQRHDVLDSEAKQKLYQAANVLRGRPFYAVGSEHASLRMLWSAARDIVKRGPRLRLIVVDHMGWLDDVNRTTRNSTRNDRKSDAYMRLIELGAEYGCPVIAVDHINRSAGYDKRPSFATLGSIRDGGNIEGHAHHVIFPWREDPMERPTFGELVIAKSRDGAVGGVPMHFDGARALWREADEDGDARRAWFEMRARTHEPEIPYDADDGDVNPIVI